MPLYICYDLPTLRFGLGDMYSKKYSMDTYISHSDSATISYVPPDTVIKCHILHGALYAL